MVVQDVLVEGSKADGKVVDYLSPEELTVRIIIYTYDDESVQNNSAALRRYELGVNQKLILDILPYYKISY